MNLGTIFTMNEYDEAYKFANKNGYDIKEIESKNNERQFKIVEIPTPTNEDISNMRSQAYIERTDRLTLRKLRKQALNKWTEEDEAQYIKQITEKSEQIEQEYPYIEEKIDNYTTIL